MLGHATGTVEQMDAKSPAEHRPARGRDFIQRPQKVMLVSVISEVSDLPSPLNSYSLFPRARTTSRMLAPRP